MSEDKKQKQEEKEEEDEEETLDFELTKEDLEAITKNKSKVVPNLPPSKKTPFTIENAPVAKSVMPAHFFEEPPLIGPNDDKEPKE